MRLDTEATADSASTRGSRPSKTGQEIPRVQFGGPAWFIEVRKGHQKVCRYNNRSDAYKEATLMGDMGKRGMAKGNTGGGG